MTEGRTTIGGDVEGETERRENGNGGRKEGKYEPEEEDSKSGWKGGRSTQREAGEPGSDEA